MLEGGPWGGPRSPGGHPARPRGGRARGAPGHLVAPLWLLFCEASSFFWKISSVNFQLIWRCSVSATQCPLFSAESCVCCFGTGKLQTV